MILQLITIKHMDLYISKVYIEIVHISNKGSIYPNETFFADKN